MAMSGSLDLMPEEPRSGLSLHYPPDLSENFGLIGRNVSGSMLCAVSYVFATHTRNSRHNLCYPYMNGGKENRSSNHGRGSEFDICGHCVG